MKRSPEFVELDHSALEVLLKRIEGAVSREDYEWLCRIIHVLWWILGEVQRKGVTIARLRRMVFGPKTKTSSRVLSEEKPEAKDGAEGACEPGEPRRGRGPRKGHGRRGAADSKGAERQSVPHPSLSAGDPCPACLKGKLYPVTKPAVIPIVFGRSPVGARIRGP